MSPVKHAGNEMLRLFRIQSFFILAFLICAGTSSCSKPGRTPALCAQQPRDLSQLSAEERLVFLKAHDGAWKKDSDRSKGLPPPPVEKAIPAGSKVIDLVPPAQFTIGKSELSAVIKSRRSLRDYSQESLTLEELSFLLWSTQGISQLETNDAGLVVNQFRTVPSGGARHPFETYLAINRVASLAPGVYRYLPVEHKLLLIKEENDLPSAVSAACYGQEFVGKAAVVFIWSTIPYRTQWAYGYLAEKLIAVDAGHVCENLYLASESIGAGTCAILGYNQKLADSLIQVDGAKEFAFYFASVGKKALVQVKEP